LERFVAISGCSGGGKSTLVAELGSRGFATVEEPGRRIVKQELQGAGTALPWVDGAAFARRAITMALEDRQWAARTEGWVFFDRSLIDAASHLQHLTGEPALERYRLANRYHQLVVLTPPWPVIYANDPERRHGFDEAQAEYLRLVEAYSSLDYDLLVLPKESIQERADLVLQRLGAEA
jgi:predicted ATPase